MTQIQEIKTEVVVLGSGPGGYTAAFRASDLGKKVVLIEQYENIGGVCLNVGCIPSKALLHAAQVINEAKEASSFGLSFENLKIDIDKLRNYKNGVVNKLTSGLKMLAKQRKVEIVKGVGKFISEHHIEVTSENAKQIINFDYAIIAVGSRSIKLPFLPNDPRILDSTSALEIKNTKGKLLILGGGIIGLEMATVYETLGVEITVVEMLPQLINMVDKDIVLPLQRRLQKHYKNILLETKVTKVEAKTDGLYVTFEKGNVSEVQCFDQILSAIGRTPNGKLIDAEKAQVKIDDRGFIKVDKEMRTNVSHIFAIGDVVGNPMLAHKASAEARVAAEVICGHKKYFDPQCIPSVAYTDPEIAWVGITENLAKEKNIDYGVGVFPWAASGRSLSIGRNEGKTKLIFDKSSHKIIGGCIVGTNAGELISEIALAINMECKVGDIASTIHPHPTLSETNMMASEVFEGTVTDIYLPK